MRSLYLRIWLTVVLALAAFALASGWLWNRHLEQERARFEAAAGERLAAWAELVQRSLPSGDASVDEQAQALREWSIRLRVPMALDDREGRRVAASDSFARREADGAPPPVAVRLDDGRTLWVARRMLHRGPMMGPGGRPMMGPGGGPMMVPGGGPRPMAGGDGAAGARPLPLGRDGLPAAAWPAWLSMSPLGLPPGVGPLLLLVLVFIAVAAGAYPVVRRLTRRLEALRSGVEAFGAGALGHRVDASGRDEVAAVAVTFNRAADRIESLVRSHQSLLANASHELRSPLARLKMAVSLYADSAPSQRESLRQEIDADVAELDALVEEVLLASRLEATEVFEADEPVHLLALAAEEAARVGAQADGVDLTVRGSERLLRRALRNLLENARRYGQQGVAVGVGRASGGTVEVRVLDAGPGVPEAYRERIFEPFFRLPGHAEREGGVGLGLSLVRQIARRHGGQVRCEPRAGGGSCFVLTLPVQRRA